MLSFIQFDYPIRVNLVSQMSRVDMVRVSLQSDQHDNALKRHGHRDVNLFKLNAEETMQLSVFDKVELFVLEAARRRILSDEIPGVLKVAVSDDLSISIDDGKDIKVEMVIESLKNIGNYHGRRRKLRIGDNTVETVMAQDSSKLFTFWEKKWHGFMTTIDFFNKVFEMPVEKLTIDGSNNPDYSEGLLNLVDSCSRKELGHVNVGFSEQSLSDNHIELILKKLSAKDEFCVHSNPSKDFQFYWELPAPIIHIKHGHWFKLDNLIESGYKCKHIKVENIEGISEEEAETFVKDWGNEKFPDLLSYSLESKKENYEIAGNFNNRHYLACSLNNFFLQ